jgi:hypothetical protein
MSKSILRISIFLFLSSFSMVTNAQRTAFKINLLSPIARTANVSFERRLSASSSSQIGFFYTTFSISGTEFKGFGITPEYRFYLSDSKEAIEGFYLAPFFRYQNLKLTNDLSKAGFSSYGGGLVVGRQWVFKKRITLDLFVGPKYLAHKIDVTSGSADDFSVGKFSGFGIRSGITLGIAF